MFTSIVIFLFKIHCGSAVLDSHTSYQGHLHCGAKISGQTSTQSGFEHYYSFVWTNDINTWRISSCGSHIYTTLTIWDDEGTVIAGTNGGGCEANVAMIEGSDTLYTYKMESATYYIAIRDDYESGGFYVLSFECSPYNDPPSFYYNSTLITRNETKVIACNDTLYIPTADAVGVYEFYATSTVDISALSANSIIFHINSTDSECWNTTIYYLDLDNEWIQRIKTSAFKKGTYKLVVEQLCVVNTRSTVYMQCDFAPINRNNITYYHQSPWIRTMDDISCGLKVKGHAMNGKVNSYEFATVSSLSVLLSSCIENYDDRRTSIYKYEALQYEPYILDDFGFWTPLTAYTQDTEADGCNRVTWSHLNNNTHYLVTIAIPYWLSGDFTIYMQCSDNAAVRRAIEYSEYIEFEIPAKSSAYVEPSKHHVLLCNQTQRGYLSSFDVHNAFYAFKVKYHQYFIEFDSCLLHEVTTFDAVFSLFYFNTDREWVNVEETHSDCNILTYFGVEPGYYYIDVRGFSSFEYGNFSISMNCIDSNAIVSPNYDEKQSLLAAAIGIPVAIVFCLICVTVIFRHKLSKQRHSQRNNNMELQQAHAQEEKEDADDGFTPQKPHKKTVKHMDEKPRYDTSEHKMTPCANDTAANTQYKESDDDGVIKSQRTLSYSAMNCVICLDILLEHEASKLMCGHKFHTHCIEEYSETNNECPLCRKPIVFK